MRLYFALEGKQILSSRLSQVDRRKDDDFHA